MQGAAIKSELTVPFITAPSFADNITMKRQDGFSKDSIVSHLTGRNKEEAIRELLAQAAIFSDLDCNVLYKAVLQREKSSNTAFGHGVAVAHGKLPGFEDVRIALGFSSEGIDYGARDGEKVHFLFLVISPPGSGEYFTCLTAITRVLHCEDLREKLAHLAESEQFPHLLNQEFLREKSRYLRQQAHTA